MLSKPIEKNCEACEGWVPPLSEKQIFDLKEQLDAEWEMDVEAQMLYFNILRFDDGQP